MKFISIVKKLLIMFLSLVTVFFLSLVLVCTIPSDSIKKNIGNSLPQLLIEGDYPRVLGNHKINQLDNYADSIILNILYNIDENKPVQSALKAEYYQSPVDAGDGLFRVNSLRSVVENNSSPNTQYPRYWHGYMVIIRPLLTFMPYTSIRKISQIIFFLLFSITISLLSKKISISSALAFSLSLILVNLSVIPLTIHASFVFFIALIGVTIILILPDISIEKTILFFFTIGALTSYTDLLSAPLITFGLPAITFFLLQNKKFPKVLLKDQLKFFVYLGASWAIGYISIWAAKWILASIVLHENVILQGISAVLERTGRDIPFGEVRTILPFDPLIRNFQTLYTYSITNFPILYFAIPSLLFATLLFVIWHRKKPDLCLPVILIIIGVLPYLWFAFTPNHSYIHHWFTSRIQAITIFALLTVYLNLIDWRKMILGVRGLGSFTKAHINNKLSF